MPLPPEVVGKNPHRLLGRIAASLIPVSECPPRTVRTKSRELLIGLSSLDNSAVGGARPSREYRQGSSSGLRGSVWDDSWVHLEGHSGLNRMAKRSLISELLLSYTPAQLQFSGKCPGLH